MTSRDPSYLRNPQEPIHVPASGGPPQGPGPSREIFVKMGEEGIRALLRDFYQELGRSSIAGMFPEDLVKAADKSADFFVFLCGGPPLYHDKHGPPMMRKRHMPFRIDEAARQEWLACFRRTLDRTPGFPLEHRDGFEIFLDGFSAWMVNTAS
jgi:hemoglobin